MKSFRSFFFVLFFVLLSCSQVSERTVNLKPQWDKTRVLANPHKGWYHHYLDNGIARYLLEDETSIQRFPGMDHLYLRLAWSYLEPEEGNFDWSLIDQVVEKFVDQGFKVSFRITSKETGTQPNSVAQELDNIMYATPVWVRQAGAKGVVAENRGVKSWVPIWDDPVYLEKLDNFHDAFAQRYDGKAWVSYIDVGSIGEWGEGHTHFSTKIPPTVAEVKTNLEVYLDNYKKTQLVVTDDLLYYGKSESEVQELFDYAVSRGFTLRDDSPLVTWYVDHNLDTWSVSHPHFYEPLYLSKPIILEAEHYHSVLNNGNWIGKNGETEIPDHGVSGADILRGAIRTLHATYIGYHGFMGKWLNENPDLAKELANLCGYWYFPIEVSLSEILKKDEESNLRVSWINRGVAPAYESFDLKIKLQKTDFSYQLEIHSGDSGNQKWLPEVSVQEEYRFPLPKSIPPSRYQFKIKLFDPESGRNVELGLQARLRDEDGFYLIGEVDVK